MTASREEIASALIRYLLVFTEHCSLLAELFWRVNANTTRFGFQFQQGLEDWGPRGSIRFCFMDPEIPTHVPSQIVHTAHEIHVVQYDRVKSGLVITDDFGEIGVLQLAITQVELDQLLGMKLLGEVVEEGT